MKTKRAEMLFFCCKKKGENTMAAPGVSTLGKLIQ